MTNRNREIMNIILKELDEYKAQLAEDKRVSATRFNNMQIAIYGAKCIVRDAFGVPRQKEVAISK